MNVGHSSVLRFVYEWRSPDVVPHLSAHHGKDKEERQQGPGRLVVQKLQVVPSQVEQATDQGEQHEKRHGASVVGRPEHADVHVGPLNTYIEELT